MKGRKSAARATARATHIANSTPRALKLLKFHWTLTYERNAETHSGGYVEARQEAEYIFAAQCENTTVRHNIFSK
jgi:hypothetical protein